MKILIPYPDFEKSAQALDDGSLIEQVKEVYNSLLVLIRFPEMKDPWLREWDNHVPALACYCLKLCDEAVRRGLPCPEEARLAKLLQGSGISLEKAAQPGALLDRDYNAASRAILLKKVAFEYVRASGALKVHDKLSLSREEAEQILEKAKANYYWYDKFNWRAEG